MNTLDAYPRCPTANVCEITEPTEYSSFCGTAPSHLPPLQLAEQLCGRALNGAIKTEQESKPDPEICYEIVEKNFRLGCLTVEQTLRRYSNYVDPEEGFQDAEIYFDRAREASTTRPDLLFDVNYVASCMPLFRARKDVLNKARGKISHIPSTTIEESRRNLALLYDDVGELKERDQPFGYVRVGTSLAIMRMGIPAFSSTFREMCNSRQDMSPELRTRYAHSTYIIDDLDRKIPARATHKRQVERSNPLTVSLPLGDFILQAIRQTLPETDTSIIPRIEATKLVVGLLAKEAKDDKLDALSLQLLDRVSDRIQTSLTDYQKTTLKTLRH